MFSRLARITEAWVGTPLAFSLALFVIVAWGVTGPIFQYSDTWQLVINTGTTIITFLMVFLIQNAQSRDTKAVHLKLDELIRAQKDASNRYILVENLEAKEIEALQKDFKKIADRER